MAEQNVITSMLDDLAQEQPILTAICIGQDLSLIPSCQTIIWQHFNVNIFLNLPFQQRFDLAIVRLDLLEKDQNNEKDFIQMLVKLRDLFAKRLLVTATLQDEKILRALGLTKLMSDQYQDVDFAIWQFNILTYKQVPDWLNAKFWANPENWDKFRW
jgi:hypothetical protein